MTDVRKLIEAVELAEREVAKSPAFFVRYSDWEAYKRGVQDMRDAILRAMEGRE